MPIFPVNPLHNALAKGPGLLPGAHNLSWLTSHTGLHGGNGGGGFPLGLGGGPGGGAGRALPGWNGGGHPGQGIPGHVSHGHPGQGIPGFGHQGNPGQGIPGQGLIREVLGLPRPMPGQAPLQAGHPPGHVPGQASSQAAQLAVPTLPLGQSMSAAHPEHAGRTQMASGATHIAPLVALMQAPASTHTGPGLMQAAQTQLPAPQHAQVPMGPVRAELAHQAVPLAAAGAAATRAEPAAPAPPRADVAPPRADAAMGERAAMLPRAAAAPVTLAASTLTAAASASTATTAAPASTAALAAGSTVATVPAAPAATQVLAAEARSGNPLVVADRGQVIARPDIAGTYTGEGPHRRALRRAVNALPGGLSTLLMAFSAQGNTAAANRDPAAVERELRDAMMQWLFWLLAIIAYGCVAFAIIALLPVGTGAVGDTTARASTGGFALFGLLIAAAAWLIARRLGSRRQD
ncbi:hypothetical protein WCE37_07385 [Luteimonas sp. MJ250]|uniref:hypothetical protein n=1 Tax=Luteimonas sp. MJ250 TaxID=3129236 RepID=UPI0031BB9AD3